MTAYNDVEVLLSGSGFGREKMFDDRRFAGVAFNKTGAQRALYASARRVAFQSQITHFNPLEDRIDDSDRFHTAAVKEYFRDGAQRKRIEKTLEDAKSALGKLDARAVVAGRKPQRRARPIDDIKNLSADRIENALAQFDNIGEARISHLVELYSVKTHTFTMSPIHLAGAFDWIIRKDSYDLIDPSNDAATIEARQKILEQFSHDDADLKDIIGIIVALSDSDRTSSPKDAIVILTYVMWIFYDASGFFESSEYDEEYDDDEASDIDV